MIIRREHPGDTDQVRTLFSKVMSASFYNRLNADRAKLPALSFVAIGDNEDVIGHVAATRGQVESTPVLALVPPSVDTDQRGKGVGKALMHSVLGAAEALGEPLVGVVAYPPEYLTQFGFHPGKDHGLTCPVDDWQPRPLTGYGVTEGGSKCGSKTTSSHRRTVESYSRRRCPACDTPHKKG